MAASVLDPRFAAAAFAHKFPLAFCKIIKLNLCSWHLHKPRHGTTDPPVSGSEQSARRVSRLFVILTHAPAAVELLLLSLSLSLSAAAHVAVVVIGHQVNNCCFKCLSGIGHT